MKKVKVSVIMGVFNSDEQKIKRAINSILNQSYHNMEFIICDDCSTNGISKYLRTLRDPRVRIIKNEVNSGLAYSLNNCLENAKGEYIARMDDDDISDVNRIEKQVCFLDAHPEIDIVGTNIWLIDGDVVWGEDSWKEYPQKKDLLFGVVHAHPTIMVRRSAYDKVNGYRVLGRTQRTEDYDLYMRMYAIGIKGYNLQEKLFYYTLSSETLYKRKFKHRIDEMMCRMEGFHLLKLYPLGAPYVFKPIISGLIPNYMKMRRLKDKLSCVEHTINKKF